MVFTSVGIAFKDLNKSIRGPESALYPSVGLRTPGEIVEANFGAQKFVFDIDQYVKEEKSNLWHSINASPLPPPSGSSSAIPFTIPGTKLLDKLSSAPTPRTQSININDLVLNYLIHSGFSDTAESFARDAFPQDRATTGESGTTDGGGKGGSGSEDVVMGEADISGGNLATSFDVHEIRRRKEIRACVLDGDMDRAMGMVRESYPGVLEANRHVEFMLRCRKFVEMIVRIVPREGGGGEGRGKGKAVAVAEAMEVENGHVDGRLMELLAEVVAFGQGIQKEFRDVENGRVRSALTEIYSLLAYPEPWSSPMSYLLNPSGRHQVAEALNGAILEHTSRTRHSALERIYRQSVVVNRALVSEGSGAAGLVNLEKSWKC
ncbi:hypothetical protein HDV00_004827 [Rhizophlyctis rosea]|nr:hypothetical protein HDV00_004827 [Rhizophlyctis rosea]